MIASRRERACRQTRRGGERRKAAIVDNDQLILGRYRPIAQAGSGGFATVQVAWDMRIQRRVAIKCIELDEGALSGGEVPGLEEARTAAMLSDPSIAGVYDFEVKGNYAYLIMEYVDGMTLTKLLREAKDEVDPDVVAAVFEAVSHALETAHDNQVLHLDIKPDNILINRQGQVKVTDFGLAQLSDAAGFGQARGGTIGYMPPEQMRFEALDGRCDQWALASVVYEMVSGTNPFLAHGLDEAVSAIEGAELVLPSLCMEGLDPSIDDVLFCALDPDREERFPSVSEFAEELEPCLGSPKQGVRKLSSLVGACLDDGDEMEEETDGPTEPWRLLDRVPYVSWTVMLRVWGACNALAVSLPALAAIPQAGGLSGPIVWVGCSLSVVLGAASPALGAVLSLAFVAAAFAYGAAYALAAATVAFAAVWWWAFGRFGKEQAVASFTPALAGGFGLGAAVPLVCGGLLTLRYALAAAAWGFALSLLLGSFGSPDVLGWSVFSALVTPGVGLEAGERLVGMLSDPGTWCVALAWALSAVISSLGASRGSSQGVLVGGVVSGVVMTASIVVSDVAFGSPADAPAASMGAFACLLAVLAGLFAHYRAVAPEVEEPVDFEGE